MADSRIERIARNESRFRELNERLEESVVRRRSDADPSGFVCECGDADCDETVRLTVAEFERIRGDSQLFLVVPGHEIPEAERVVERHDGYVVVRKRADAAEIVEETDRRS